MPIEVTLPMVLDAHTDARMQDTHVAVPGTIVSWSAATQEATVQPMVRKPLPSADGVQTYETPPQNPKRALLRPARGRVPGQRAVLCW